MNAKPNHKNERFNMATIGCLMANDMYLKALTGESEEFTEVLTGCRAVVAVFDILGFPILTDVNTKGTRTLESLVDKLTKYSSGVSPAEFFGVASEPPLSFTADQTLILTAVSTLMSRNLEGFIRLVEASKEFHLATSFPPKLAEVVLELGVLPKYRPSEAASTLISALILLPALILGALHMTEDYSAEEKKKYAISFTEKFLAHLNPETPEILPTAETLIAIAALHAEE